ncbi:hypothetical protein ScPMuIL_005017 [Solemya velum]
MDIGLWYLCFDGTCIGHTITAGIFSDTSVTSTAIAIGWIEFQIEATVGVVAALCGLFLTCVFHKRSAGGNNTVIIISGIVFLVSGISAWIPAGKFAQTYSALAFLTIFKFPYSVVLTGIGASVALLNAVLIFVLAYRANQSGQPGHVVQSGYPMQQVAYASDNGYPPPGQPAQVYTNQGYVENQYAHRKY